jgi:hypothetical protein
MAGDPFWADVVTLLHADGANTSTAWHDSSLSAHTIAGQFGVQIDTAQPKFGTGSIDFVTNHGSGPCLNVNTSNADFQFGSGDFTIECWVYPTGANNGWIMQTALGGAGGGAWGLSYDSATPALNFVYSTDGTAETSITATTTLPLNTWSMVAADFDGTTLRLYVNGAVVATGTLSGALFATTAVLSIGNDNHTDGGPWTGYIDELRITKGAARYAGAFTAPTAAFPAYGSSPQPELGGAGSGHSTNSSVTYALTTWEPNEVIVVAVANENHGSGNPAVVASVTGAGLEWEKRASVSQVNGGGMEVWWAFNPTPLIGADITIAFTGTFDDNSSVAFAVAGCNQTKPWDPNGSLPAAVSGFTLTGVSTTKAHDTLLTFVCSESGPGNPFGYTTLVSDLNEGGSLSMAVTTGYDNVSSAQSNLTLSAATGTFPGFIADALTADA